jgi:transposase-like protein
MDKPKTLQQAIRYFTDEQICIDTVAAMRWPNGPVCPACEHKEHYYLKTQKRWKCKECGRQFSVKLGTIFEDSPLGLDKWLAALWMLVNCKNGISSYEVGRALGVTQKSAWFMLHRLRFALQSGSVTKIGGPGSEFEVDETFVGGKAKNMHKERRSRLKHYGRAADKAIVMGILERRGQIHAKVVPDAKKPAIWGELRSRIHNGSTVYTDEATVYQELGKQTDYVHEVINHMEKYVNGRVSTNGVENFWSLLKRGLNGTYIAVEPFHLFRYVDEQVFRFNNRGNKKERVNDADRFSLALSQIAGKRLTFAEVTGKVGQAAF